MSIQSATARRLTISTPAESLPPDEVRSREHARTHGRTEDDGTTAYQRSASTSAADQDMLDEVTTKLGFRQRIELNPALKHTYKVCVGIVGVLVLCAGIVMIPFPGPGWLVVIAGLAILSTEFAWADRLLRFTKKRVFAWMHWINAQPLGIRLLCGLITAAFVYGALVVVLHLTGVPGWVPQWIPLWR